MPSKLFERAARYHSTFAAAMPKLPSGIQVALQAPLGTATAGWALALVLAGWRLLKETDSGDAQAVLKETGAQPLVDEVNALSVALPEPFKQALTAAEAESDTFAGAATYLAQAFTDMIALQLNAVVKWMGGELFRQAGAQLTRRFQPPGSQLPATWSSPPPASSPSTPDSTPPRSRLDRFEQADRPARRVPKAVVSETASAPAPATNDEPASAPPAPKLPPETVARIHLMTQAGWKGNDAERILSGPSGDSGSALRLRQILRTYVSLSYPQRMRFQGLVGDNEGGFQISRSGLLQVSISDVQDVRGAESLGFRTADEVFSSYQSLPIPERQRMLRWITDQEPLAFSTLQLPELFASYRNLEKIERMRFLKLIDEVEREPPKDAWKSADISWIETSASPKLMISAGTDLYREYRRLPLPKKLSLLRAAIDTERAFDVEEIRITNLGKISPEELE